MTGIATPSTAALDRARKLAIYAREGVPHAWLIDPLARTLEVLHLEYGRPPSFLENHGELRRAADGSPAGRWTIVATHAGDETVCAAPFADVELPLAALWPEE
jgi:hypothetical protein